MDLKKKLDKSTDKKFKGCQTQRLYLWFRKPPCCKPAKSYKYTEGVLVQLRPHLQKDSDVLDIGDVGQT